jgi:hypothetical protein
VASLVARNTKETTVAPIVRSVRVCACQEYEVRLSVICWYVRQNSGFSLREDVFTFNLLETHFMKLINSSRADSRVNSLKSNVSGAISVPIIRAMIILWPECPTYIPPKSPCSDPCASQLGASGRSQVLVYLGPVSGLVRVCIDTE